MKWEVTLIKIVLLRIAYVLAGFLLASSGFAAGGFLAYDRLHHSFSTLSASLLMLIAVCLALRLRSLLGYDVSIATRHYRQKQIRQLTRLIYYRFYPNIKGYLPTYGGFILFLQMDARNIRKADTNNSSLVTVRDDTYMAWIDFFHDGFHLSGSCHKEGNQMLILIDFFPTKRFSLKKAQSAFAALSLALFKRPWYYEDAEFSGLWRMKDE